MFEHLGIAILSRMESKTIGFCNHHGFNLLQRIEELNASNQHVYGKTSENIKASKRNNAAGGSNNGKRATREMFQFSTIDQEKDQA